MNERVLPPCAAYQYMASILGDHYFRQSPPIQGVEVTVMGSDRIASVWCMSPELAAAVKPHVTASKYLRWVSAKDYRGLEPKP